MTARELRVVAEAPYRVGFSAKEQLAPWVQRAPGRGSVRDDEHVPGRERVA